MWPQPPTFHTAAVSRGCSRNGLSLAPAALSIKHKHIREGWGHSLQQASSSSSSKQSLSPVSRSVLCVTCCTTLLSVLLQAEHKIQSADGPLVLQLQKVSDRGACSQEVAGQHKQLGHRAGLMGVSLQRGGGGLAWDAAGCCSFGSPTLPPSLPQHSTAALLAAPFHKHRIRRRSSSSSSSVVTPCDLVCCAVLCPGAQDAACAAPRLGPCLHAGQLQAGNR